jgi:methylglyoxal synthase
VLWNIPVACSRASADFLISSPLLSRRYTRQRPDFTGVAGLEPGGDGERAA